MDSTNPSELSFYIVFESYNSFILFLNLMILLYCFRTYESFNQNSSIAVAQKPCSY